MTYVFIFEFTVPIFKLTITYDGYLEHQMTIEVDDCLTQQLNSPQISSA